MAAAVGGRRRPAGSGRREAADSETVRSSISPAAEVRCPCAPLPRRGRARYFGVIGTGLVASTELLDAEDDGRC